MKVLWIKTEPSVVERGSWLDSARGTFPRDVKEAETVQTAPQRGELVRAEKWSPGYLSFQTEPWLACGQSQELRSRRKEGAVPVLLLAKLWKIADIMGC